MTLPIGTAEERELVVDAMADAIWNSRQDAPDDDYSLRVCLSRDEARRAAEAALNVSALQSRIAEVEALLERVARIEGALHKRMHIYRTKRDAADPLADDTYNRHDAFALVVEAFDIFETESGIRASLTQGGE